MAPDDSRAGPAEGDPDESGELAQEEFTHRMGVRYLGMQNGAYTLELDLEPWHMSRARRAHGGVLFTLLDTALGRAVIEGLPAGRGCATVELKINYFRPVQGGTLRAAGRLLQLTRSLAYAEGEVTNAEGKALARASGTFFLTTTMAQADKERL